MKKFIVLMLLCAVTVLYSCEKEYTPQEVEFSIDYTFETSGSMTRANGEEVYTEFYKKYIETKLLTPKTYTLQFTNNDTKATATICGNWGERDAIRLPEGSYTIEGFSQPVEKYEYSDSVFIAFNQVVNLRKDDSKLVLNALYDSFLLLFDAENTTEIKLGTVISSNSSPTKQVASDEKLFWLFLEDTICSYNREEYAYSLSVYRKDGNRSYISLKNTPLEKGKFYYFNDLSNSFDIPPMESGN